MGTHQAPGTGPAGQPPVVQRQDRKPQPVVSADVFAAARKSNDIDAAPDAAFRNIGTGSNLGYIAGDPDGAQNHAIESALARKAIKDLLPGGTELLINKIKKMAAQPTPQRNLFGK